MGSWGLDCVVAVPALPAPPVLSYIWSLCPQHTVTLVPVEEFSMEFVEPRVRCVSSHGTFGSSR